jgi:hypothetical protein
LKKQEVDINIIIHHNPGNKPSSGNHAGSNTNTLAKIKCKASVAQLGYFFRLMYDLKAITNANQTEILKFIVENFETPNAKEISLNSLRGKYYDATEPTKETVKAFVIKILNQINTK